MQNRIPKIIHYCWFGKSEMSRLALKCIQSWHEQCPDYKIMRWDESNFDVNSLLYTKQAYESKKYAFVTDYVRLYALYNYGGIYMDTDVEVLRNIDNFLDCGVFSGFENNQYVPTGIMGACQRHELIKNLIQMYDDLLFVKNGHLDLTTNTNRITKYFISSKGLIANNSFQVIDHDIYIYPKDYFCPKDPLTGKILMTNNTYTIHHFAGSWGSKGYRLSVKMKYNLRRIIGNDKYDKIKQILKR